MMTNSNYENGQNQSKMRINNNNDRNYSRGKFIGNKGGGGFRIRLSDNEMKSAKRIQEAFNLKSTVAVLGFSVRTLSEMIDDEDFRESIKKYAVINKNNSLKDNRSESDRNIINSSPNPFARPKKEVSSKEEKHQEQGRDGK